MAVVRRWVGISLILLLVSGAGTAAAQGFVWPGPAAPCNSTLQACVDGVIDNAVISIDSDAPTTIHPTPGAALVISRNLTLMAAPGRQVLFPLGVGIAVHQTSASSVQLRGISLRGGAEVTVLSSNSSGIAQFTAERMRFEHLGIAGAGFEVTQSGAGTLRLRIRDNDYLRTGGAGIFAGLTTTAGRIEGEVAFNRIALPDGFSAAYGILAAAGDAGHFDLTIAANRLHGSFVRGALCAVSNSSSPSPPASAIRFASNTVRPSQSGAGVGICIFAGEAAIAAQISNNTLIDLGLAILLTPRPFSPPTAPQPISGYFANNLIAYNSTGVTSTPVSAGVSNRYNLYFGNGSIGSGFTPGAGSLFSNPNLSSRITPYLGAGSPAIDAGDMASVPAASVWPSLDADGLRRSKGATVDIGAYEYGDGWFDVLASPANQTGNTVLIDHPTTNNAPAARIFATPDFSLANVVNTRPHGVYWQGGAVNRWRVFNEDLAAMPLGAGYNLFAPAAPTVAAAPPDLGLFVHRLPTSGATNPSTLIDHPSLNDRPDQIALITQNWNPQDAPASSGVYNNSIVTLQYFADQRWRIANVSGNALPNGAAFNVYAQPPSPNAFVHVARLGNLADTATLISHPFIDGIPCARIQVTSIFGEREFDVYFNAARQRWAIFGNGGMSEGSRFNVLFSPRQVYECSAPLFADGFES